MFNSPAVGWGGQICARSLLTTRNMSKSASPQAPPRRDNSARCWCLLLLLLEAMWLLVVSRRSPGNYCRFSFNERDAGWLSPRISKRLTPHNQILHMKDGGRGASAWFFPARVVGMGGGQRLSSLTQVNPLKLLVLWWKWHFITCGGLDGACRVNRERWFRNRGRFISGFFLIKSSKPIGNRGPLFYVPVILWSWTLTPGLLAVAPSGQPLH